jgi:uncharacterized protein (DUF934 family)
LRVFKDGRLIEDGWRRLADEDELPAGDVIVSLPRWRAKRSELERRAGRVGICIEGGANLEDLVPFLSDLSLVAVDFPHFKDGRGYSLGRLLREKYAYAGELRAIGHVLRDQLHYLRRCGFDSFEVCGNTEIEGLRRALTEFSLSYQPAADGAPPIDHLRQ